MYMGSFWGFDDETKTEWTDSAAHQQLLVREKEDLVKELVELPQVIIIPGLWCRV